MQKHLKCAIEASTRTTNSNFPHGSAIIKGGKVMMTGCNSNVPHCHAESLLLKRWCEKGPKEQEKQVQTPGHQE